MEEKERYGLFGEHCIKDNDTNVPCQLLDTYKACVILNQQYQRIKELEDKDWYEQCIKSLEEQSERLIKENQQLKEELIRVKNNSVGAIQNMKYATDTFKDLYYKLKAENQKLTMELNDWKQRFASSEKRNKILLQNSATVSELKNDKIRQLEQSQKQIAISELEKVEEILWNSQDIGNLMDNDKFLERLNNQIESLKGEE